MGSQTGKLLLDNKEISKSNGIILSGTGDARSMRAIAGSTAPYFNNLFNRASKKAYLPGSSNGGRASASNKEYTSS